MIDHIIKTGPAQVTPATALAYLWAKSADRLTRGELASFAATSGEWMGHELGDMALSMESVACLVAGDQNPDGDRSGAMEDCSPYLLTVSRHLQALAALSKINGEATNRLLAMMGDAA